MSLMKWALFTMIVGVLMMSSGRAAMANRDLEAVTLPEKIYVEHINGHSNYCFHLILINRGSELLALEEVRVRSLFEGHPKRLQVWDSGRLKRMSGSGDLMIPASGKLLLRSLRDVLDSTWDDFSLDILIMYKREKGEKGTFHVEIPLKVYRQKSTFSLPFSGKWFVINGHGHQEAHRLAARGQAFAWDFTYRKDGRDCKLAELNSEIRPRNEDFYGFGQPVLSPADGEVVKMEGNREDETPNVLFSPFLLKRPENPFEILGNYTVIRHAGGEYSLLAHLQKGSVLVRAGELVTRGQKIGRCGNSGDSTYPHIHFQVMNGPDHFRNQGIPVKLSDYKLFRGKTQRKVRMGTPSKGDSVENERQKEENSL